MDLLECESSCWTCHHIMRSHANLDCWEQGLYRFCTLQYTLDVHSIYFNLSITKKVKTPFREHLREAEAAVSTGDTAKKSVIFWPWMKRPKHALELKSTNT